jgi:hypothetical protein
MADMIAKMKEQPDARRSTPNPMIPPLFINMIIQDLEIMKEILERSAANIRVLDRMRINNVGSVKTSSLALKTALFLKKLQKHVFLTHFYN